MPTVPGTPGHPENHLLLLAVLGVSGVPGTVDKQARGSITSRGRQTSLVASIRAEAPMTALRVRFMGRM